MTAKTKIYLAVGAVFVVIVALWAATLPYSFAHVKKNTAARPVDPALAEVRARIREFRTNLQVLPSFPRANATISETIKKSLEAKLKATASSSSR